MTGELADTQLRMQAAITADVPEDAAALVNGSPRLPARARLELYRSSYQQRLCGCLRDAYPALRYALGDELFDDFALDYLAAHPPRGPSLASLGAAFPDHLARTRPDRGLAPEERESWPDFLVDLARAERAFWEVYDGPGVEGLPLPRTARELTGDCEWPGGTAQPVPCLRLLAASYPVDEYLSAVRQGERPALPARQDRHLAMSRRDFAVTLTVLEADEHAVLADLLAGAEISAAAGRWLEVWADRGWLMAIHTRSNRGAT